MKIKMNIKINIFTNKKYLILLAGQIYNDNHRKWANIHLNIIHRYSNLSIFLGLIFYIYPTTV